MLTQQDLNHFCGTTHYYPYLAGLKLTDGVKYLDDEALEYYEVESWRWRFVHWLRAFPK